MAGAHESPEHCQKTSKRRIEARTALIVGLMLAALSLIGWLYLTQTSHLAVTGYYIQEIEQRKARLQEENAQLEAEIAALESASRLMARAKELGFQPPERVTYVVVANYPVNEEVSGATDDQKAAVVDSAVDTSPALVRWWRGLVAQFDAWLRAQP
ncbi:MAG: hypothetical protein NUW24_03220 [Anaerolineae bacterium]|nr:hypothetical protein [Anaerolineae bacterium]MDH7473402.1 hypothetical protein [Anaerolineae bacterium]